MGVQNDSLLVALLAISIKLKDPQTWDPLPDFLQPLAESDLWDDNDVVSVAIRNLLWLFQALYEGDDGY